MKAWHDGVIKIPETAKVMSWNMYDFKGNRVWVPAQRFAAFPVMLNYIFFTKPIFRKKLFFHYFVFLLYLRAVVTLHRCMELVVPKRRRMLRHLNVY